MTLKHSNLQAFINDIRSALDQLELKQAEDEDAVFKLEECAEDDPVVPVQTDGKSRQKPLPDQQTQNSREELILSKLTELGRIGSPEAWKKFARVAEKRITKWIRSQRAIDTADSNRTVDYMARRQRALEAGIYKIGELIDHERKLQDEKDFIETCLTDHNPWSGLSKLANVDPDLKMLRTDVNQDRETFFKLQKDAGEPPLFAAVLGRTSSMQKQIRDCFQSLSDAESALMQRIEDMRNREAQGLLTTVIDRELSTLPQKSNAEIWLREAHITIDLLKNWMNINRQLHSPEDEQHYIKTQELLEQWQPRVQKSGGYEQQFQDLQSRLNEISPGCVNELSLVQAIHAEIVILEASLLKARNSMYDTQSSYNGPAIFQALANNLNTIEDKIRRFVFLVEETEDDATTRALNAMKANGLGEELNKQLDAIKRQYVKPMEEESNPGEWLTMAARLERALRTWDSFASDLEPPPPEKREVLEILGLLQRAQVIIPEIRSAETEFERRRTIEFAQASTDPQKLLVLHAAFERLEIWLEPQLSKLQHLKEQSMTVCPKWTLFHAITADTEEQVAKLKDFHERLRLMHYKQESASPDEVTASGGGGLNLEQADKDAINQHKENLIESYLNDENAKRARLGQEALNRGDIAPELEDVFERRARRMVSGRTSRYAST